MFLLEMKIKILFHLRAKSKVSEASKVYFLCSVFVFFEAKTCWVAHTRRLVDDFSQNFTRVGREFLRGKLKKFKFAIKTLMKCRSFAAEFNKFSSEILHES
jgi:hypothetical protein